jgi:hypothetical protein
MRQYKICAALAALLCAADGFAQFQDTHAIVGARIEIGDGRVIESGNVVIRDGRIVAAGANAPVPGYAHVIEGKGLTVYPGFIDGYFTSGLNLPDPVQDQDAPPNVSDTAPASMRQANRRGVRPELLAAAHLGLTPQILNPERRAGFTTFVVAPTGGSINGVAAVVDASGGPRRDAVLNERVGMGFGFRSGPGTGYPGSLMGVQAHLRQTLIDAQAHDGRTSDPVLAALAPVVAGTMTVFFEADNKNEIARALEIARLFRLRLAIVGGSDAYEIASRLKEREVPVVATLDLGREPTPPAEFLPGEAAAFYREEWRKKAENLKHLHDAGVPFALSGRGTRDRAEFFRNLAKVVELGLPREAALRALTSTPARLFGVEAETGTVAAGKRADLVVMSGDFLDPKSRVRFLFVNGDKFEPDRERAAPSPPRRREDDHDGCGCDHDLRGGDDR